jgi:hypothetical protein
MTATVNVVLARTMGRSFTTDPDLQLPFRPRLIPELLVFPFEKDGVLFAGAEFTQVVRGRSARGLLSLLLPWLDGTRAIEDLHGLLPDLRVEDLVDTVSLLFSRGLIEDGQDGQPDRPELSETASFLGRYNDVSRCNRNRDESMGHVAASSIRVVGEAILVDYVVNQLLEAGASQVLDGKTTHNLTFAVSTGDAPVNLELLESCVETSETTLLVRLGAREAHIGPRFVKGVTVCPACFVRIHPHPAGTPNALLSELWLGLAAQRAFLQLSRIAPSTNHRIFDQVSLDPEQRMLQQTR